MPRHDSFDRSQKRMPDVDTLVVTSDILSFFLVLLCQSMALQHFVHLLDDGLWRDAVHASQVMKTAWLLAINGAWAAREAAVLDDVALWLSPRCEACFRVGGAPYRDGGCPHDGCDVHVRRVHGEHEVELRHQQHLVVQTFHFSADADHPVAFFPF